MNKRLSQYTVFITLLCFILSKYTFPSCCTYELKLYLPLCKSICKAPYNSVNTIFHTLRHTHTITLTTLTSTVATRQQQQMLEIFIDNALIQKQKIIWGVNSTQRLFYVFIPFLKMWDTFSPVDIQIGQKWWTVLVMCILCQFSPWQKMCTYSHRKTGKTFTDKTLY